VEDNNFNNILKDSESIQPSLEYRLKNGDKTLSQEEIKSVLKKDGTYIRCVWPLTEELKLIAVKQKGSSIQYLCYNGDPSEEIQLEAVKQCWTNITFIKIPSEAVKLAAVKKDGIALRNIKNPSEEVKLAAVKSNGLALGFIKDPSDELQLEAIKSLVVDFKIKNLLKQEGWTMDKFLSKITYKEALDYYNKYSQYI
jgi:hypothetical protein